MVSQLVLTLIKKKNAYVVAFKKGTHELTSHLEKKDAVECMDEIKCVYLGVQIGQLKILESSKRNKKSTNKRTSEHRTKASNQN